MSGSDIELIVDYTAKIAAGIEGVVAVFGSGSGATDDPLRAGQKIDTCPANATAAFTHWSEIPTAPTVEPISQEYTVQLSWNVPMRLWLPKQEEEARRLALPFYDRYLRAFLLDPYFGARPDNLVTRTEIKRFSIGGDSNWSWLDVGLLVVERVNYGQ